jgi:N-formylglutamate amidohydrolase
MIEVCSVHEGRLPLLISVPHDGCHIPPAIMSRMAPAGLAIPDTDWHVAELYDFARDTGASLLIANYSRYVVDLNRSSADEVLYPGQVVTGLCPTQTFAGDSIYRDGGVTDEERAARVARYWQPYHDALQSVLAAMRAQHGYALLWDAHSIPSQVPRLFEGELPVLNIGSNAGNSCDASLEDAVVGVATDSGYGMAVNARFKGGYITRHYGNPAKGVHALQLEIAQRAYMNETTTVYDAAKANRLRQTLSQMLDAFLAAAR